MATADLITSFLTNEMSPEQEREFLLSIAASDSLRLELKSHVMLDRILVSHAQRAQVPDGVRAQIFAEAGISASDIQTPANPTSSVTRPAPRSSFLSRFGRGMMGLVMVVALFSFALGYYAGTPEAIAPADQPTATSAKSNPQTIAPATSTPASVDQAPVTEQPAASGDIVTGHTAPRSTVTAPSGVGARSQSTRVDRTPVQRQPASTSPTRSEPTTASEPAASKPATDPSSGAPDIPTVSVSPIQVEKGSDTDNR